MVGCLMIGEVVGVAHVDMQGLRFRILVYVKILVEKITAVYGKTLFSIVFRLLDALTFMVCTWDTIPIADRMSLFFCNLALLQKIFTNIPFLVCLGAVIIGAKVTWLDTNICGAEVSVPCADLALTWQGSAP